MERSSEFLVTTILLDVVLIGLLQIVQPPGDPRVYMIAALVVVSPLLAYLFAYRWDLGRSTWRHRDTN